ncbi:hypothetical protein [Rubrobacter indicoceani]|uniref:hypothetical protein n=1 Tax=Rubrobacter indicoceani TaxID=2051957 RepID=UPI0013C4ABC9|nr:hypothetical protein [Rubrobacter indicoceani]
MNKMALAMKILKHPQARKIAASPQARRLIFKAMQNEKVRKTVMKQVTKNLFR